MWIRHSFEHIIWLSWKMYLYMVTSLFPLSSHTKNKSQRGEIQEPNLHCEPHIISDWENWTKQGASTLCMLVTVSKTYCVWGQEGTQCPSVILLTDSHTGAFWAFLLQSNIYMLYLPHVPSPMHCRALCGCISLLIVTKHQVRVTDEDIALWIRVLH